jgi:hydrocephalus-inducing protein
MSSFRSAGGSLSARAYPGASNVAEKSAKESTKLPQSARGPLPVAHGVRASASSTLAGSLKNSGGSRKVKRSPSEFIAQNRQFGMHSSADEGQPRIIEFLNLSSFSHHSDSVVPIGEPLFKPTPGVIAFVDFEGLQTYDATLSLRNQDNVARRVKVLPPDSSFFEVLPGRGRKKSASGDRVAPGMEVTYTVRFKPDTRVDYSYDLIVVTEREKFTVPVRATGGSAIMEFPDSVSFGATPVKYQTSKTVLIRNIGDKSSKFLLKTRPPFSTSILDGYLEVGASMQVDVLFKPDRVQQYEGELVLAYGDGIEAYVSLHGSAENVEIAFSESRVVMNDTFIALSTQSTIMVHNHSDVPVDFSWRAFPTIEEEIGQKLKLQVQLKQEESEECTALMHLEPDEADESEDDEDDMSDDSLDVQELGPEMKMVGSIQRRYRNIAKAIMEDPMFFYDEIFAVEPLSGRIWAKSKASITITFTPKAALTYQCIAYCSIVGQADRMPLLLNGQGIGPKAAFSYDELDAGDVFVESQHQYHVDLINQGDIAVNFQLAPNMSPFGSKFKFTPSSSRLEVGGSVTITVEFCPDLLGEFNETFYWDLVGSASSIPLTFKGHSVSPTFHFDVDRISFGVVSYGFLNSKTLTLTNDSEVTMRFALRIPGDGRFLQKEFDVIPPRGTLLPNCSQKIQIDFISVNVKTYDLCLVVDLDGVGQELSSIPIQGRCAVPSVTFEPQEVLEYNDIFIRYPAHRTLVLHNTSALPAQFQILPQDEPTRMLAEFEPDQAYGSVPPASSHVITLTLTSQKIGPLQIPLSCRILGHTLPQQVMLTANSIGPIVNVDPAVLDWGNVNCLEPVTRYVKVTNDSVIDASVRAFMKTKNSLWTIEPKSLQLKPHETVSVAMTLTIDETVKTNDLMHLVVPEGKDITVTTKAKGIDTPVTCKESLSVIDFGTQYTTQRIEREFLIENRGRQPRKLVWLTESDTQGKKKSIEEVVASSQSVFSVKPDTFLLNGKSAYHFQFTACCPNPGRVNEVLLCQEFAGNDRKGQTAFRSQLCGDFVAPLLSLSMTTIEFKYQWQKDKPIAPMYQVLGITNVSKLDVKFHLKVQPPFGVNIESFFLKPQEMKEVRVEFDPCFKVDRVCGVVKQLLTVVYMDHPQKDSVNLVGEVVFPNIALSQDRLDFGSVLNDTTKQLSITISNPGVLPLDYEWMFCEEQDGPEYEPAFSTVDSSDSPLMRSAMQSARNTQTSGFGPRAELTTPSMLDVEPAPVMHTTTVTSSFGVGTSVSAATSKPGVDINQIFDILPIMGHLEPGEEHIISFTYFGLHNRKFNATAVCVVEGGPEYEVSLKGQASRLEFRIDKTELDFGDVAFTQVSEKDIYLSNVGKVAYFFNINLSAVSRPYVLDASPLTGLINADEKQKITIRFRAGIPDAVCEVANVEVAHFEPTKLTVRGRGCFPGVLLSTFSSDGAPMQLSRLDQEGHQKRLEMARERLQLPAPISSPEPADSQSPPPCPADAGDLDPEDSTLLPPGSAHGSDGAQPQPPPADEELPDDSKLEPKATQADAVDPELENDALPLGSAHGSVASQHQPPVDEEVTGRPKLGQRTAQEIDEENIMLEFEVDRNFLCEALLETEFDTVKANRQKIDVKAHGTGSKSMGSSKGVGNARQLRELPPMTAAYYVCDFGNIVLGQTGRKSISILNCYDSPVSFTINRKLLLAHGYTVAPEKAKNLPANQSMRLELTCFQPKDAKEGREELDWIIPIKDGPSYEVKLISNFVLPDLVLSPEVVDFGRVLVGQRKRVTVRLKNEKAVPVDWEYKAPRSKYGKPLPPWETIYTLSPSSGKLQPGDTMLVTISFTPNATKAFSQKLALRINDNPNKKTRFTEWTW